MNLSQKCQYTVRGILELAKHYGQGAMPASEIAANQAIPQRFLEIILNEIKPSGIVDSRRGIQGGYFLVKEPKDISVGQIIRLVEGPLDPVRCTGDSKNADCPLMENCSLIGMWKQAKEAVEKVYDSTSFQDLVDREKASDCRKNNDYCI